MSTSGEDPFLVSSAPPAPPRNKRGDVLAGRYELLELVGRGGSASVFRGLDRLLHRTVAIKVAYPEDSKQRARLIREARIGAQLHHSFLMPVLDLGIENHCLYIVMPYIAGPTLGARINAGRLPWRTASIFVHQLLVGLAVLHGAGVVHRDVKSDNCLLWHDASGTRLILADFGLARVGHTALSGMPSHNTSQVIGSIGYMAPERIDSPGDVRSDVYSAGVVLFEALTRRLPFRGYQGEVLWGHAQESPSAPSSIVSSLPHAFDDLIATALAKEPRDRFQTAGEFDAALLTVIGPGEVDVIPTAGVDRVFRALSAWEDCSVSRAIVEARHAEVCDRRWAGFRELLEVVREAEVGAGQ